MKNINALIITIGDELLIGQVIDTNSAWIAQELNKIGVWVSRRVAIGDVYDDIWQTLDASVESDAEIILITGGLGPTNDDITKPLLCKYFGGKMLMHEPTLAHVSYLFEHIFKRQMPLLDVNRKQAEVPDVCKVLKNDIGTAPGMLFEKNGKIFISMPGVPQEMKFIVENSVLPLIKERFHLPYIGFKTLTTAGIGESALADKIKDFENNLPKHIKLAYLPNHGFVRLRLTTQGEKSEVENDLENYFERLKAAVKEFMAIEEDISFEILLGRLLKEKNKTVSTAESCTGGYIAHLITSIAGSSDYFMGSVVSYDNSIKENVLGVQQSTIEKDGAVSEATAREMVKGVLQIMQTDYAVAVSGIMGPGGGSSEKPVGTVWMAVGNKKRTETKMMKFRFDRKRNIELTAINALHFLCTFVKNDN
ncbi:MAG: CinA family nicotinamide mononucleotide deamidase-related protein [Bacteroidetes bacterium]|nr:CinA family nicotinamide mononucleotide deamidase-related protein [Bacteroidota bacterium]